MSNLREAWARGRGRTPEPPREIEEGQYGSFLCLGCDRRFNRKAPVSKSRIEMLKISPEEGEIAEVCDECWETIISEM